MSNATARSTRRDARAFADAFAEADDAFTFGPDPGVSRTLSLDELGEVLGGHVALPGPRQAPRARAAEEPAEDELLTLDELGEVLGRREREADALDFDFGTSAHERARRRTAARFEASSSANRRSSGPARRRDHEAGARPTLMADAAAASAEQLAAPTGRFTRASVAPAMLPVPARAETPRREVEKRPRVTVMDRVRSNPDRFAMWAVLLGILLVLIAFTSGSGSA